MWLCRRWDKQHYQGITYALMGGAWVYKADVVHTHILVLYVHGVKGLIQETVSTLLLQYMIP